MTEPTSAHHEHHHVAAVFADHEHATVAVDELRSLGLGSEHLGIAVRGTDDVVFEFDEGADTARDTAVGAAAGAPIGALAGIGLVAAGVPGLAVGGVLALAGVSALWGAMLGAFVGTSVAGDEWDEHEALTYTPLERGQVLVVVCGHGREDEIRDVVGRHGGRPVPVPRP